MIGGLDKLGHCVKISGAYLLAILVSSASFADDVGLSPAAPGAGIAGATLPAALASASGPGPETGIPFQSWMLYPSLFVGGIYNTNIYQSSFNQTAAQGVRLTPNVEADFDNGIHKTTVYGNADAQLYPGYNSNRGQSASTLSARAGLAEMWSPTSDVVVRFSVSTRARRARLAHPCRRRLRLGRRPVFA